MSGSGTTIVSGSITVSSGSLLVAVAVGLVVISIVFSALNPIFLAPNNLVNLLFDCATVGVISLGIVCVLVLGIVGYAATAEIRGAVIAQGNMVVEGNVRKVQHQDGGIVSAIHARNGQRVKAGDLLLRLDDTQRRAEFGQVAGQLMSQELRAARLEAERDNLPAIALPASVTGRLGEPEVRALVNAEATVFEARRRSQRGEEAQLRERVVQTREEIAGLEAQHRSVLEQAVITEQELGNLQGLQKQGLTQVSRVNPLRRSVVQLEGQAGDLTAQIARARGRISEIELQITQIEKQALNEVTRDLRETKDKIADLMERRTSTDEKLRRTEIRAPIDAVVHQLAVFTIGGVVAPGEAVMQLVPEGEALLVEGRIEPSFIDQVVVGQGAVIRLSSLDSRTTPELSGKVTFVSADIEQDQRQPGLGPAVAALGIPVQARVAEAGGAMHGVPRQPAVGDAVDQQAATAVAAADAFERASVPARERRRGFVVADVRQPDRARNMAARAVRDEAGRQPGAGRAFDRGHHVDRHRRAAFEQRVRLGGIDGAIFEMVTYNIVPAGADTIAAGMLDWID